MKKLVLAALVAATAVPAFAADNLGGQRSVASAGYVELDTVRAETGGRVEILDGTSLSEAVALGDARVRPGLQTDVRVQLDHAPFRNNVLAVLYDADGEITATRELRVVD